MITPKTASSLFRTGNLDRAMKAAEVGMERTSPNTDEYQQFLFVKAECLRTKGQVRQALELIGESINESGLSPETCALWHMHRGYFLGMRNAYVESKQEFDKAEDIASNQSLSHISLDILLRRAMILFFAEELVASQDAYRKALQVAEVHGDLFSQALALAGTGNNLMIRKNYREAVGWYEKALVAAKESRATLLAAAMQSELGWCFYNMEHDDKALELFRASEAAFLAAGALTNYQISLGNIGNIFVRRGDYPAAVSYFQRALELAKKNEDRISMAKWLNNLSDVFFRMGNPVLAGEYQRQLMLVKVALQRERARVRQAEN